MKRDKIFSACWAGILALLLGLGSVGCLATGLDLPVDLKAVVIWCAFLAIIAAFLSRWNWAAVAGIGLSAILSISDDFQIQAKTLAAAIANRLWLAYQIPIPELLQGELSETVLAVLCLLSLLIMMLTARCVQKQKSCLLPVLASLVPLAGCITVIDTVPDTPWLFLWGLGLILLLLTQGVRRRSPSQGNRLGGWLLLPTVGALVLLFALIPRDAVVNWWLPIADPVPGNPLEIPVAETQEQVDLRDLGPRSPTRTKVMEVTTDFSGPLYLRCRDYDEYTGTGWLSSEKRNEILYGYSMRWHMDYGKVKIKTLAANDYYAVPNYTQQVQSVTGGEVQNPRRETAYTFDRCVLQPDWAEYVNDNSFFTLDPRYLDLPEETAVHATVYLTEHDLAGGTPIQQAEKIRAAVRDSASYNLFTPNMPMEEQDLALWFLGSSETGYCVHFATAAAVLLRAAGIPARYVEGYLVQAEAGKPMAVQERHAHAWVEYYVNQVGWVILEATPSDGTAQEEPVPEPTTQPSTEPTQTTTTPTEETTAPTQPKEQEDPQPVTPKPEEPRGAALLWICGGCLALVLLMGQYVLRRLLLQKALKSKDPNHRGLVLYRQIKKLCRFLRRPIPEDAENLARKARFSHHQLTKQELKQMNTQRQQLQKQISQAPLLPRLLARWILALY